jgi:biopolymer transport protein ExbD
MKRTLIFDNCPLPGFQIAPMIDVVFVVMLFFMVLVSERRAETEIRARPPGTVETLADVRLPDAEITLGVEEDGSVSLNGEPFDRFDDARLPELARTLRRLSTTTRTTSARVLATVEASPGATYQRVIDVLNALHAAGIAHVTFGLGRE